MTFLLVASGGFAGAVSRYAISIVLNGRTASGFPLGTFFINLTGTFLLGCLIGSAAGVTWQLLLGVGFAGAFTTFSTFNFEAVQLFINRKGTTALYYLLASYGAGLILANVGYWLGHFFA